MTTHRIKKVTEIKNNGQSYSEFVVQIKGLFFWSDDYYFGGGRTVFLSLEVAERYIAGEKGVCTKRFGKLTHKKTSTIVFTD